MYKVILIAVLTVWSVHSLEYHLKLKPCQLTKDAILPSLLLKEKIIKDKIGI